MVGSCTGLLIVGTSTFLSKPIHNYTGKEFCMIVNSISVFGITYGIYGGTGIALMRFIFIKGPSKINEKIGKRNCAKLISLVTLVMTIGSLYVWIKWSRTQDKENQSVCLPLLNSKGSNATSNHKASSLWQKLIVVGVLILIGSISAELSMYVSIYKFLISNDKKMKLVLPTTAVSKRVRRNVISLTGHAVNFAAETLWSVILFIILIDGMPMNPDHVFYLYVYDTSIHGILSGLHIVFSRPLKNDCYEFCLSVLSLIPPHNCLEVFIKFSWAANSVQNLGSNTNAVLQDQT